VLKFLLPPWKRQWPGEAVGVSLRAISPPDRAPKTGGSAAPRLLGLKTSNFKLVTDHQPPTLSGQAANAAYHVTPSGIADWLL